MAKVEVDKKRQVNHVPGWLLGVNTMAIHSTVACCVSNSRCGEA